jgi:hypothetical protein
MAASANELKKSIGHEIYFLFEKHPELLYFGSVSPDIFFYDIKLPWEFRVKHRGLIWGELIHGTQGENSLAHIFEMFAILAAPELQAALTGGRALNHEERGALTLFVLGYLTHVALDTVMHPIVYYYAGNYYAPDRGEKLRAEARHRAIETVLDLYNLAQIQSDLKEFRALKKITLPDRWRDLVLGLYTLAITRAWPRLVQDEFGDVVLKGNNIRSHPLFVVARRGYKKQLFFNRLFQNLRLARWGLWFNRKRNDALHFNSSLLYPAASYAEYQRGNRGQLFAIGDLKEFRNPLNNEEYAIHPEWLSRKALARSHAFFRAGWLFVNGKISRAAAERVLKGFSLNNGRVGVPTNAMQYFSPLPINGNFEYLRAAGGIVPDQQDAVSAGKP